ncbi:hypothetical protein NPIL_52391 [Nephila pilipes]|uniref:Uncharacterized protein n=1 Tax=Nephila pilipes TaxID=299642 RepID=A0A8X6PE47_NEPPI|nr:hypothetical protein NPIL_52391 [Nephila pilipes]
MSLVISVNISCHVTMMTKLFSQRAMFLQHVSDVFCQAMQKSIGWDFKPIGCKPVAQSDTGHAITLSSSILEQPIINTMAYYWPGCSLSMVSSIAVVIPVSFAAFITASGYVRGNHAVRNPGWRQYISHFKMVAGSM